MDKSSREVERQLGVVKEALPGLDFKVSLVDKPDHELIAYLGGRMKMHRIRILPGDKVLVEVAPDGRRGRIVRRM